jgi:hypothetical protein
MSFVVRHFVQSVLPGPSDPRKSQESCLGFTVLYAFWRDELLYEFTCTLYLLPVYVLYVAVGIEGVNKNGQLSTSNSYQMDAFLAGRPPR